MASAEFLTRLNVLAWDMEASKQWHAAEALREARRLLASRFCCVTDNEGHHYFIPTGRCGDWAEWLAIPSDDERAWKVPDFATPVGGSISRVTFSDPKL